MKSRFLVAGLILSLWLPCAARCQPPELIATWTNYGPLSLCRPWGLAVDGAGDLYVADPCWSRVFVFTSTGDTLRSWNTPLSCRGLGADLDSRVYVTSYFTSGTSTTGVLEYTQGGDLVFRWDTKGSAPGQFINPYGVALDKQGNVYVSEQGNARVQVLTSDGAPVTQWGSRGTGPGQFGDPEGIAIGPDGLVYVTDADNQTVQVFTTNGVLVRSWGGELGGGPGQFHGVRGIAIDAAGRVYVADTGNDRIQVFTSTGVYLTEWGRIRGSGPEQFDFPLAVAVGRDGHIYVADTLNGRIQVFGSLSTPARNSTWGQLKRRYR